MQKEVFIASHIASTAVRTEIQWPSNGHFTVLCFIRRLPVSVYICVILCNDKPTTNAWKVFLKQLRLLSNSCVQVVQEYERAVIFRLGRLLPVGAKGPGE